jgi:hypothetical protein
MTRAEVNKKIEASEVDKQKRLAKKLALPLSMNEE